MPFKEDFDYMYRGMIANLPLSPPFLRLHFEKWWNELCVVVDNKWVKNGKDKNDFE